MIDILRKKKPLVLCLTNYVTMNSCANALIAIGASPIMSEDLEDALDLMRIADSLVINIGTASEKFMEMALFVAKKAKELQKPIILDPVGVGATKKRAQWSKLLIDNGVSVIKGNKSEIGSLLKIGDIKETQQKGVDADSNLQILEKSIIDYSIKLNSVIMMTGSTDTIVYKNRVETFSFGTPLFEKITGAGCLLNCITGAFLALHKETKKDFFSLSKLALLAFVIAGEKAASISAGPGSFLNHFLDHLHIVSTEDILHLGVLYDR